VPVSPLAQQHGAQSLTTQATTELLAWTSGRELEQLITTRAGTRRKFPARSILMALARCRFGRRAATLRSLQPFSIPPRLLPPTFSPPFGSPVMPAGTPTRPAICSLAARFAAIAAARMVWMERTFAPLQQATPQSAAAATTKNVGTLLQPTRIRYMLRWAQGSFRSRQVKSRRGASTPLPRRYSITKCCPILPG